VILGRCFFNGMEKVSTTKATLEEPERNESPNSRRASISTVGPASRVSSVGSTEDPKDTREEKFNRAARMVMFTKWFTAISFSLAAGSMFLFIWGTANHSAHWTEEEELWFDVLNLLITVVFGVEILVRYFVLKKGFWQSCWNVFDIFLLVSCVIETIIGFIIRVQFVYTSWRLVILFARYSIQLLRLLCILRHQRQLVLGVSAARDEVDIENYNPQQLELELINLSHIPIPTLPTTRARSNSTATILPSHIQPPLPLSIAHTSSSSTNTEKPQQKEYSSFSATNS